ncbi:hypothetical protein QQ045_030519 [Rhodiola kirilowii]
MSLITEAYKRDETLRASENCSGKKSLDPSFSEFRNGFNIVGWAKMLLQEGREPDFFARELWELGPKEKLLGMLNLAARCTVKSLTIRPSMKQGEKGMYYLVQGKVLLRLKGAQNV